MRIPYDIIIRKLQFIRGAIYVQEMEFINWWGYIRFHNV